MTPRDWGLGAMIRVVARPLTGLKEVVILSTKPLVLVPLVPGLPIILAFILKSTLHGVNDFHTTNMLGY